MSWGIEGRVPFLGQRIYGYCNECKIQKDKMVNKAEGKIEKWVLRKAFEDLYQKASLGDKRTI